MYSLIIPTARHVPLRVTVLDAFVLTVGETATAVSPTLYSVAALTLHRRKTCIVVVLPAIPIPETFLQYTVHPLTAGVVIPRSIVFALYTNAPALAAVHHQHYCSSVHPLPPYVVEAAGALMVVAVGMVWATAIQYLHPLL